MDFNIRFTDKIKKFVDIWPNLRENLRNVFRNEFKQMAFATTWPVEIEDFCILLKLFPLKNNREPFVKSIEKFIVFREVIVYGCF